MRAKEVVISNPKRNSVISTIVVIVTARDAVRSLKSAIHTLNNLLKSAELGRNSIHNEPNKSLYATNFDISFIGDKGIRAVIMICALFCENFREEALSGKESKSMSKKFMRNSL